MCVAFKEGYSTYRFFVVVVVVGEVFKVQVQSKGYQEKTESTFGGIRSKERDLLATGPLCLTRHAEEYSIPMF